VRTACVDLVLLLLFVNIKLYKDQDSPLDDSTAEDCNLLGSLGFSFIIKEEV